MLYQSCKLCATTCKYCLAIQQCCASNVHLLPTCLQTLPCMQGHSALLFHPYAPAANLLANFPMAIQQCCTSHASLVHLPANFAHDHSTVLCQSCKLCAPTCKLCLAVQQCCTSNVHLLPTCLQTLPMTIQQCCTSHASLVHQPANFAHVCKAIQQHCTSNLSLAHNLATAANLPANFAHVCCSLPNSAE